MRLTGKILLPLLMLLWGAAAVLPAREMPAVPAELADYVAKPEPAYGWTIEDTRDLGTIKGWRLKLTSQVWEGITWTHDLLVVLPAGVPTDKVLLINDGGGASEERALYAAMLAGKIKAPVALLLGVPNQPLLDGKKEDDLIAETFVRYLDSGDSSGPLL
ncbi:MAG: PhoPQ-activated pathogenicity protein, partial [Akkermansiaceae bacterium]|nr:PhoPQ-activated pathogenicity protein [Akkermansiaceae bacterium]